MTRSGRGEGVLAAQLVGLAEQRVGGPAIGVGAGIAQADIGAGAAFDTVVAGKLVALKQRGGVEDEALGVFVGDAEPADICLVRAREDLRHGLEDMAGPSGSENSSGQRISSPAVAMKRIEIGQVA